MPSTHAEIMAFFQRTRPTATSSNSSSVAIPLASTASGTSTQMLVESMSQFSMIDRTPFSLLEMLSLLKLQLQLLSTAREDWWDSPVKTIQRREFVEVCDQKKLTSQQVVNNKTRDMIADMEALLGRFVRCPLGVKEGLVDLDGPIEEAKRKEKQ